MTELEIVVKSNDTLRRRNHVYAQQIDKLEGEKQLLLKLVKSQDKVIDLLNQQITLYETLVKKP